MDGFHDVRLPLSLAFGASGGPELQTEVTRLASGYEVRNARWAQSRRRWDLGGAVLDIAAAHALAAFFEARRGRLYAFRFRDPLDATSSAPRIAPLPADQLLGVGDGSTTRFRLLKRYGTGDMATTRIITRPDAASVRVAINGGEISGFTLDASTGWLTLAQAPATSARVTAGFTFDVPVRFDTDRLETAIEAANAIRILRAPIVEVAE